MNMQNDGSGFDAFLNAAREAEKIIRSRPDINETDLAEGYLYMAGMWQLHLERAFKGSDVDRPCFVRVMDGFRTWGMPTPDHHYFSAQIDGRGEYRISGQRGNTVDYCFEMLSGLVGDDGVIGQRIDALEAGSMHFDADGRYELFVGGAPRTINWLKAGTEARTIFVRQTANDWRTEQATPMLIERLDVADGEPPFARPTPGAVQALYQQAGKAMLDQIRFLNEFSLNWAKILPVNELPTPTVGPADAGYFPGQFNTKCRFSIASDEALIITMEPSTALYQSLTLGNPHWFNNIHPRSLHSSLNAAQSKLSNDGRYRYVISAKDPGVANWLDTGGHTQGFLFVRYQRVSGNAPGKPQIKRVPLAAVRDECSSDEPVVGENSRAVARRMRRLSIDRRFF